MGNPEANSSSLCFCYILECADGSFYTGWTKDPGRRLRVHNAGRGSRYTRARRPVRLVLVEPQNDRAAAMKRERSIKAMPRRRKIELIRDSSESRGAAHILGGGFRPGNSLSKA